MPDKAQEQTENSFFAKKLAHRQFFTTRILPLSVLLVIGALVIPPLSSSLAQSSDKHSSETEGQVTILPVAVAPAEQLDRYRVTKPYTGTIVAGRRSEVGFERPGKVVRLLADEGDRVSSGQPLAELDRRRLDAKKRRVEAELAESTAVLAEFEYGPRKQTIAAAEAELKSRTAQRAAAARHLARRRELIETRSISREEYDESRYQDEVAEANMEVAQKQLDELKAGTRKEKIDAQRARVEALRASLADINHEIEDAILMAPFGGIIARRHLDEGSIVSAGTPVFDLVEQDDLEAWVGVPAKVAQRLSLGDLATVIVNEQQYPAQVQSLRPELHPSTRTRNVVFELRGEQVSDEIVAGQVARILLDETVQQRGFWVPTAALTPRNRGLWAVYVVEQEVVAARDVQVLHTEGDRSFVTGTLAAGDSVVVSGAHKVVVGQRVRPTTSSP